MGGGGQRPANSLVRGAWVGDEWAQMSTARGGWGQQTMGTRTLRIYKTNYGGRGGQLPRACVSGCSFWNEEGVVFTSYSVAGRLGEGLLCGKDEGDDETVEAQHLRKDENQDHAHE